MKLIAIKNTFFLTIVGMISFGFMFGSSITLLEKSLYQSSNNYIDGLDDFSDISSTSEDIQVPSINIPRDGTIVSGTIDIIAYVKVCNCTGVTQYTIDNTTLHVHYDSLKGGWTEDKNIGTPENDLIKIGPNWIQVFHHTWDTTLYSNGLHELTVYGKHNELIDTIEIIVKN